MGKEECHERCGGVDRSGGHRPDRLREVPETLAGRLRGNVGGGWRGGTLAGVRVAVHHRRLRDINDSSRFDRQRDLCRDAGWCLVLGNRLGLHRPAPGLSADGSDLRWVRPVVRFRTGLGMARGTPIPHRFRARWRAPSGFLALCRVPAARESGTQPGFARKLLGRRHDHGRGPRVATRTELWLATAARDLGAGGGFGVVDPTEYSGVTALSGYLREGR